jgi:hypothetical protein
VLATVALEAGDRTTKYLDITQTAVYYFARFKDSVAGTYSSYSDGVYNGGFDPNTVGYMIKRALRDTNTDLSTKVTVEDCYDFINDGIREIRGKQKRWPEHYKDNQIIGQTSRGSFIISMPSDIYDTETNRSIVGLRIGGGRNLRYLDPTAFDVQMGDVKYTQVRTQAAANDTSLAVDNSYDFEDSGTLSVYVSGTKDSFTYTAVTRDTLTGGTAAFTGVPSSGDDAIGQTTAVDTYVWQNEVEGEPSIFTVRNGQIEIWPLPDDTQDKQNVYADYATVATAVNSQGDTIDYHRYDMLQSYLTWRVECRAKLDGKLDVQSSWFAQFKERLNDAIRTRAQNRVFKMSPKMNTMSRHHARQADVEDLSVDDQ